MVKALKIILRIILIILAFGWAEWFCMKTNQNGNGAVLHYIIGLLPLALLAYYGNQARKKKGPAGRQSPS